jgi:hypothetical protein
MSFASSSVKTISQRLPNGLKTTNWKSQSEGHVGAFNSIPWLVSMTVVPRESVLIEIAKSSTVAFS